MPRPSFRAVSKEAADRAGALQSILLEIRQGRAPTDMAVNDLQLLSKISTSGSAVFYHLTQECREALRDGGRLPWGA